MKRLGINELKTGMYVAGIFGGDNRITVKQYVKQYGMMKSEGVTQAYKRKELESINLARPLCPFEIQQAVTAEEYNINME